jgi:septum formation protein
MPFRVVLASASPRRKELLSQIFEKFEVIPSDFDESSMPETAPPEYVEALSKGKCRDVVELFSSSFDGDENVLVIAADTIVVFEGKVYGKPKDREDAVRMLISLSGNFHEVYTGVTLALVSKVGASATSKRETIFKTFAEVSKVKIKDMGREEIENYVDTFRPYDKAGAYALQEGVMVESFKGSYSNIVGLPMERLEEELQKLCALQN